MTSTDAALVTVTKTAHVNDVDLLLMPELTDLVRAWLVRVGGAMAYKPLATKAQLVFSFLLLFSG